MKASEIEKQEAIKRLREMIQPGDTIYTILRHVSRSGMSRRIDVVKLDSGDTRYLTSLTAKACGYQSEGNGEGLKIGGCGMDMGFAIVHDLGRELFKDGWECTGDNCQHNSHTNDRNAPKGKGVMHKDGSYSLKQRWL